MFDVQCSMFKDRYLSVLQSPARIDNPSAPGSIGAPEGPNLIPPRPATHRMARGDTLVFLTAFLRHPAQVGAIAPSSRTLARAIVKGVVCDAGESVLEFGPGTAAFTEHIRRILPGPGAYLGIEREPRFVSLLRERYPELRFVTGSAENAGALHAQAGLGPVRAIISGLPFASLSGDVQDRIVHSARDLLGEGGLFRTFQYVHAYALPPAIRFRRKMRKTFGACLRSAVVFRNLPPAFVLTWTRTS